MWYCVPASLNQLTWAVLSGSPCGKLEPAGVRPCSVGHTPGDGQHVTTEGAVLEQGAGGQNLPMLLFSGSLIQSINKRGLSA